MSTHCGYVCELKTLKPHPNADKLQLAEIFGNITQIDTSYQIGDVGIYFPTDLQLSEEFCVQNHLMRKLPDGSPDTGYMDPDKRNVKTIKLRGETSDGIWLPIRCLDYAVDTSTLKVGDTITVVNGHQICDKYIPHGSVKTSGGRNKTKAKKKKINIAPLFAEHKDTEQLAYNLSAFKPEDFVEVTLKMHGTSQRTGYLPVFNGYNDSKITVWKNKVKTFLNDHMKTHYEITHGEPVYDWDYVCGTRRTVLENWENGFYGSDLFRQPHHDSFVGKLHKGETVYYEVVGFTDTGASIMADCDNKKINDKTFRKIYGDKTVFSYGCTSCESKAYVYRMTMTNEDGDVVEYSPEFMRYRCEQMGVETVPVFWRGFLTKPADWDDEEIWNPGEYVKEIAESYYDGPDPIGYTHVREGVVCRIVNRPTFTAYKHKNVSFKILEGIVKEEATIPDMEEAQEIDN